MTSVESPEHVEGGEGEGTEAVSIPPRNYSGAPMTAYDGGAGDAPAGWWERRPWLAHIIAAGLVIAFVVQAIAASFQKSPAFDEPGHTGAALSYVATHDIKIDLAHPPLLREIAGYSMRLSGVRWVINQAAWDGLGARPEVGALWEVGDIVLFADGKPLRTLFWARLPLVLIAGGLGVCLYLWGRRMLGTTAGLSALALFAFDPTMIAHSALVTTDVGCAAFVTFFSFALWQYLRDRTMDRLVLCGLALGGALGTKYSAVFLIPITLLTVLVGARWIPARAAASGAAFADPFAEDGFARRLGRSVGPAAVIAGLALAVIYAIYFFPAFPTTYAEGLAMVNADHQSKYEAYMAGEFSPRFWSYFVVAYLLKEPIATVALVAVGLVVVLRSAPTMDRMALLVPAIVFFAAPTILSHDLGFRYVIPALPFLYLIGGAGAAWLIGRGRKGQVVAAICGAWLMIGAAGIYPDHLSYFNEGACLASSPRRIGLDGGTRCGPDWLDDSNVDWGQGLIQLRSWLEAHPSSGPVYLAYHGSTMPQRYGLNFPRLAEEDLYDPPGPGRWIVSAHFKARVQGTLAESFGHSAENWVWNREPTAIVGHAFYIYDVPRAR